MKIFNQIQKPKVKSSTFNLSHERKMSLKMGYLYPSFVQEVIPGDKFINNSEILLRVAPMLAPVMHRVNVFQHFFFVPYRILWDQWENFITGGPQGDKNPVMPYVTINETNRDYFTKGTLADYLGLPANLAAGIAIGENVSVLPFRAYQLIYDEYYKDQNLIGERGWTTGSGDSNAYLLNTNTLRKRAWMKDYFTSALPWAQRGGEAVAPMDIAYNNPTQVIRADDGASAISVPTLTSSVTGSLTGNPGGTGNIDLSIDNIESVSTSINELRKSVRLQEWLERSARGGARYIEQILSHFGVRSKDERLQRPEYLGGGMNPVVMSEVLSNFQFNGDTNGLPQGNMAGHGISVGGNMGFSKYFEEHGIILGILSVLPNTGYSQGIHRLWTKTNKFDFPWPEFANLGEQEIKNKELYFSTGSADNWNNETFGYQSRYADYKFAINTTHGDFRDNLSYWHLDRLFGSRPSLNQTFVECVPDTRIFNVIDQDVDNLYALLHHSCTAKRKLPYFGTPAL